jgi:hypothetical protein
MNIGKQWYPNGLSSEDVVKKTDISDVTKERKNDSDYTPLDDYLKNNPTETNEEEERKTLASEDWFKQYFGDKTYYKVKSDSNGFVDWDKTKTVLTQSLYSGWAARDSWIQSAESISGIYVDGDGIIQVLKKPDIVSSYSNLKASYWNIDNSNLTGGKVNNVSGLDFRKIEESGKVSYSYFDNEKDKKGNPKGWTAIGSFYTGGIVNGIFWHRQESCLAY